MNIQIVLHSKSGTTFRLGEIISDKLMLDGHTVNLTTLQTTEPIDMNPRTKQEFKFTNLPDVSPADAVIIGAPVWAFRPSPVIVAAVKQLGAQLKGKKVLPFLTMGFPFAWMTGNASLASLRRGAGTYAAKGCMAQCSRAKPRVRKSACKPSRKRSALPSNKPDYSAAKIPSGFGGAIFLPSLNADFQYSARQILSEFHLGWGTFVS